MGQLVGGFPGTQAQPRGIWYFFDDAGSAWRHYFRHRSSQQYRVAYRFNRLCFAVRRRFVSRTSQQWVLVFDTVVFGHRLVLANAFAFGFCCRFLLLACLTIDAISTGLCSCELQSKQKENAHGICAFWIDGLGWDGVFTAI